MDLRHWNPDNIPVTRMGRSWGTSFHGNINKGG